MEEQAESLLRELGMSEYETKACMVLVKFGNSDANKIASIGSIPLPRVYDTMDNLAKRGLISVSRTRPQTFSIINLKRFFDILKLDEKKKDARSTRWRRIVKDAAEQSGRGMVPQIREVMSFYDALNNTADRDLKLIPWEMEDATSIRTILEKNRSARRVAVAIGPEGGFSAEEIEQAKSAGFIPVTLGRRILRTETAGTAVMSMINYVYEM